MKSATVIIATRGSALALAQSTAVLETCRTLFPGRTFELSIIKTTGDKMQTASLARVDTTLPRGLFTKELEEALLDGRADFAVHSLKDLPTALPEGLKLGAVSAREDVRDVLLQRASAAGPPPAIGALRPEAVVGTSSTRRSAQLSAARPDLRIAPLRGNVGTRLQKLASSADLDAIVLAAAGLARLGFKIAADGTLSGPGVPPGLQAAPIDPGIMLPCVGQGALGIEARADDPFTDALCAALNHQETWHCVVAERAFLSAMGGGCQSAIGAHAEIADGGIRLRAVSFLEGNARRGEAQGPLAETAALGIRLAAELSRP